MAEIGFFPRSHYALGELFTFGEPQYTEWTIIDKLGQRNSQKSEADIEYGYPPSFAFATFLVRSNLKDQYGEAYMRVYLQVPNKGTEFFPAEERANQAASGYHREFEAMKTFYEKGSTITPALLAYKEDVQDSQRLVPGGYVITFIFERVPGVRLAEDKVVPGYGAPLHTFFQKFDDTERDQIRSRFDEGYRMLQELGWEPEYPWADNLIWDGRSSRLYFVDFRGALKTGRRDEDVVDDSEEELDEEEVPMSTIWNNWGLAIAPKNPKDRGDLSKWEL